MISSHTNETDLGSFYFSIDIEDCEREIRPILRMNCKRGKVVGWLFLLV